MKWFKHDSNASLDAKLQRLRLKYGLEGYGMYWYLLESIARNVEIHNLTFELEEDAELIAAATNIHYERVQEMMLFMCELGLFENADGRIVCLKMASRTDEYTQKLMRSANDVPTLSRHTPEKIPPNRTEQNRLEENITEQNRGEGDKSPGIEEVLGFLVDQGMSVSEDHELIAAQQFVDTLRDRVGTPQEVRKWKPYLLTLWAGGQSTRSRSIEDDLKDQSWAN